MASVNPKSTSFPLSYKTALAILPPVHTYPQFNNLRSLYDKAFTKWPPHINLIYPFVEPQCLDFASAFIKSYLANTSQKPSRLELAEAGVFEHKNSATIWLGPSGDKEVFENLVEGVQRLFCTAEEVEKFKAHLTLGQSSREPTAVEVLKRKAARLGNSGAPLSFVVGRLVTLKRDEKGDMQVYEELPFDLGTDLPVDPETSEDEVASAIADVTFEAGVPVPGKTYFFSKESTQWEEFVAEAHLKNPKIRHDVMVSTYNVMTDSPFPPPVERYPALVKAILSTQSPAKPSVVCLQEVTDEFLEFLLENEKIRALFPFVTQSGKDTLRSLRNIVFLANAATGGFEWQYLPFQMRHKGATILEFPNIVPPSDNEEDEEDEQSSLIIAGVHLQAGFKDSAVSARSAQMKMVTSFLTSSFEHHPWIITGDFNLPTSSSAIENTMAHKIVSPESYKTHKTTIDTSIFADAWEELYPGDNEDDEYTALYQTYGARKEGEYGATFDPLANPLAAEKTLVARHLRPHRYDRVLVRRRIETDEYISRRIFYVNSVSRFGFPSEDGIIASDHWGFSATLQLLDPNAEPPMTQALVWQDLPNHIPNEKVESFLKGQGLVPSVSDYQQRLAVVHAIKEVLQSDASAFQAEFPPAIWDKIDLKNLVVEPVGSVGMGLYDKDSDVDLTCVGEVSTAVFYRIAGWRIRKLGEEFGVKLSRYVEGAKVGMMELEVKGIMVDLHYVQAPKLVERWADLPHIPASDIIFALPYSTRRKLNAYRDMRYLLATIPHLSTYKTTYRLLKLWAKRRGLYSSRFGLLGGIHLTYLLSRVSKLLAKQKPDFTVCELLSAFFTEYSTFDWANDEVVDPSFAHLNRKRSHTEPVCILTANIPAVNVAANATKHTIHVFAREFSRANTLLREGKSIQDLVGTEASNLHDFLTAHKSFIKIGVHFWGTSKGRGRNLVGWVESRIVLLLVDLQTAIPSLRITPYPARFTDTDSKDELRSFYLLGASNSATYHDPQIKKIQNNKFEAALAKFNERIQKNDTVYSPTDCYTGVVHVRGDKGMVEGVEGMPVVDKNSTWDFLGDAASFGDEGKATPGDEEEEEEEEIDPSVLTAADSPSSPLPANRRPLRPAQDILSRLRWDSAYDLKDYLIGYEDRFIGIMEISAEKWSMEKTEETWVPMHRVVWFRRKADGVKVWDRRRAVDGVFGSGVGWGEVKEEVKEDDVKEETKVAVGGASGTATGET